MATEIIHRQTTLVMPPVIDVRKKLANFMSAVANVVKPHFTSTQLDYLDRKRMTCLSPRERAIVDVNLLSMLR